MSKEQMDHSSIFVELKAMIEKDWIAKSPSEFLQQLAGLERDGQITTEEHGLLWELYLGKFKNSR